MVKDGVKRWGTLYIYIYDTQLYREKVGVIYGLRLTKLTESWSTTWSVCALFLVFKVFS